MVAGIDIQLKTRFFARGLQGVGSPIARLSTPSLTPILRFFFFFFILLVSTVGKAEDLLAVFRLAECNDAIIQAAKEAQLASREALPQARAQFMPVVNATGSTNTYDINYSGPGTALSSQIFPPELHYTQGIYALTVNQPVFYYHQWVQLAKATEIVKQANATYAAAEQDLIVRVVKAYFEVLKAYDTLKYAKEAHAAYSNFYEQINKRFEVGLVEIADVDIAKAQRDNSYSEEILAANNLENKKEQLRVLTCKKIETFAFLRENLVLKPPQPANMELWVQQAAEQNLSLWAARYEVEASRIDIKLNSANHMPLITIGAGVTHSNTIPTTPSNTARNLGFQVQLPITNGGATISKTRQAAHTYEQTYQKMEELFRQTESNTRQAYLGVLTRISQTAALKHAIVSNKNALDKTYETFKLGTRSITDVLIVQNSLIQSERNLAYARYDYILNSVLLKQAIGTLNPNDIRHINAWLKTEGNQTYPCLCENDDKKSKNTPKGDPKKYLAKNINNSSKEEPMKTIAKIKNQNNQNTVPKEVPEKIIAKNEIQNDKPPKKQLVESTKNQHSKFKSTLKKDPDYESIALLFKLNAKYPTLSMDACGDPGSLMKIFKAAKFANKNIKFAESDLLILRKLPEYNQIKDLSPNDYHKYLKRKNELAQFSEAMVSNGT